MSSNDVNVSDGGTNKGSVTGTIMSTSGGAYKAPRIQLFRQTVKQPIKLVEGKPNDKGGYSLSYLVDSREPMDLWVGITDHHGGFVARSEVYYRAPRLSSGRECLRRKGLGSSRQSFEARVIQDKAGLERFIQISERARRFAAYTDYTHGVQRSLEVGVSVFPVGGAAGGLSRPQHRRMPLRKALIPQHDVPDSLPLIGRATPLAAGCAFRPIEGIGVASPPTTAQPGLLTPR